MLTAEENELLCRVGRGTPMGDLVRRFWMPAASSADVVAGGAPKRVRLTGLDFVIFRDRAGNVALLDELCPHRGASLTLARNEDCGLRCIYHGWKFAFDGSVLEMPTEPEDSTFKDRVPRPRLSDLRRPRRTRVGVHRTARARAAADEL